MRIFLLKESKLLFESGDETYRLVLIQPSYFLILTRTNQTNRFHSKPSALTLNTRKYMLFNCFGRKLCKITWVISFSPVVFPLCFIFKYKQSKQKKNTKKDNMKRKQHTVCKRNETYATYACQIHWKQKLRPRLQAHT